MEGFSGMEMKSKLLDVNLLLKALLFSCLFYIVAHPDTRGFLLKNIKLLKKVDYSIVSMVVFFVFYYVLSILV